MAKTLTVYLAADVSRMNRGLKDAEGGLTGLGGSLKNVLGPALIAAGVAAAGFAVKLGIDGVKAAAEDQAALERLSQTLENVGLAHAIEPVEDYISSLERSLGIADTELRPAYDRLIRSTNDVGKANDALALALDISAGTGKNLQSVVDALGRAYDGNTSSLSRLGVGIDKATLSTGNMDDITKRLADTFGGQATRQAQTFEGQAKRLQTAVDNLKEAFGKGLLDALGDTNTATQDLVDLMEGFEPLLKTAGGAVGTFSTVAIKGLNNNLAITSTDGQKAADAIGGVETAATIAGGAVSDLGGSLAGTNSPLGVLLRLLGLASNAAEKAASKAATYTSALQDQAAAARNAAAQQNNLNRTMGSAQVVYSDDEKAALISAEASRDAARAREYWTSRITYAEVPMEKATKSTGRATSATNELTAAQKKAVAQYEKKQTSVNGLLGKLDEQVKGLDDAKKAFDDYAKSIEDSITKNLSFADAIKPAMDEAGEVSGASFVSALNEQVTGLQTFANVLTSLKASGAEQSLIDQIAAMGPDVGAKLGQSLINEGLVTEVQNQINTVQQIGKETGLNLSEQFYQAGIDSANNLIDSTVKEVKKERKKLTDLGKGMGKLIGSGVKAEIAKAIKDAIKAAEAAKAAAAAEAAERIAAQQIQVTDQQVGQALSRLISNSDARAGRSTNPLLA